MISYNLVSQLSVCVVLGQAVRDRPGDELLSGLVRPLAVMVKPCALKCHILSYF